MGVFVGGTGVGVFVGGTGVGVFVGGAGVGVLVGGAGVAVGGGGPPVQPGNLNEPMRVCQGALPVVWHVLGGEPEGAVVRGVDGHRRCSRPSGEPVPVCEPLPAMSVLSPCGIVPSGSPARRPV